MLPKQCEGCSLAPTAQGFCPPQPIEAHTKLVVWGEAPGKSEGLNSYGFTGASGKLLREWLRRAGLSVASAWPDDMPGPSKREDVAFRNAVLCVRPGNKFPTDEEARECLRRHQSEVFVQSAMEPAMGTPWVTYGANATRVLTGVELPILKTRGTFLPLDSRLRPMTTTSKWLVSSLHPAFLVRGGGKDNPNEAEGKSQDELKPLLGADARRAIECQRPNVPRTVYLKCPSELGGTPKANQIVSVDIEGTNGRPNIVGVSWEEDQAYVFPWNESLREWLSNLFATSGVIPCFHNASFDVDELEQAGVTPPRLYYDTINMAALYDPDQPMNLQTQVLTHVGGSVAWKGLINHEKGPDFEGGTVATYRDLWKNVLSILEMRIPSTGQEWYAFYNGLDTAWGLALARSFQSKLTKQLRWTYYTDVMVPLQRPLLDIGKRGMPIDEGRLEEHREATRTKLAITINVLRFAGQEMIAQRNATISEQITMLETMKNLEGGRKFSQAKELTKLRGKLKPKKAKTKLGVKIKDPNVFDPSSNLQRCMLLYDWYELPPIKNKGAKGLTSDEDAIGDLLNRLRRGTIKAKRASKEEAIATLEAMIEVGELNTLLSNFLQPELR